MDFGDQDGEWTSKLWAVAARVAASYYGPEPARTQEEETVGVALPGDAIANPEPFKGMGLSKNPSPRISPQVITEGPSQEYSGVLTYPYAATKGRVMGGGGASHRQEKASPAMRALVRRD